MACLKSITLTSRKQKGQPVFYRKCVNCRQGHSVQWDAIVWHG